MTEEQWKSVVRHAENENFARDANAVLGVLLLVGFGAFWIYSRVEDFVIERKAENKKAAIKMFWETNDAPICYYFDGRCNNIYTRDGWRINGFPPDGVDRQWVMSSNDVFLWTGKPVKIDGNPDSFWRWSR